MVEGLVERADVVQHTAGDDRVPFAVDLLEAAPRVPVPVRRVRVDAENVVAALREQRDEAALAAAPDLEDPTWSRGQVL